MKEHNVLQYFLGLSIFGIGFVSAKVISGGQFEIDKNLNVIDLSSLLLTPVLAYIVYSVLDKNKEDRTKEKELILKRIDDFYTFIDSFYLRTISNSNLSYSLTLSDLKRLNDQIKNAQKLLTLANIAIEDNYINNVLVTIRELKELKTDILTNAQVAALSVNSANPIVVAAGIVIYSSSRLNEIEGKFDDLKNQVILFQLKINRAAN